MVTLQEQDLHVFFNTPILDGVEKAIRIDYFNWEDTEQANLTLRSFKDSLPQLIPLQFGCALVEVRGLPIVTNKSFASIHSLLLFWIRMATVPRGKVICHNFPENLFQPQNRQYQFVS